VRCAVSTSDVPTTDSSVWGWWRSKQWTRLPQQSRYLNRFAAGCTDACTTLEYENAVVCRTLNRQGTSHAPLDDPRLAGSSTPLTAL
jgi:hypothetical protein